MRIINLKAEKIKRLIAVDITPKAGLIQITGKNAQGKSSVLDSIWWALEGVKNIQGQPINKDATEAKISLSLGEKEVTMIVTRTFKKTENGEFTTKLKVTNAEGYVIPGGTQTILNSFLNSLSFDPLAFTKMKAKEQFDVLKTFIPDVNFEAIEIENKKDYEDRREINRNIKSFQALVDGIITTANKDTKYVKIENLLQETKVASEHNADIEIRKNNRKNYNRTIEENEKKVAELLAETKEIRRKLENAGNLPEPIDMSELTKKIENVEITNKEVDKFINKEKNLIQVKSLKDAADKITKKMEERESHKKIKIATANIPIKNIAFGDNEILLNGVPLDQASQSEKIRTSMAIAMAKNPKLKVILMREGSLLDDESEKIVKDMAIKHNFDVWQEKVDNTGKIGFVIKDGNLKNNV